MSVQSIIEGVIAREGGFVNNPADRGGATCWGVTEAVARANGYTGPMRDLPRDLAAKIYLRQYVTAPGFDKIAALNYSIGERLIDAGVNCGTVMPAKWLQRTLNLMNKQGALFDDLTVDGKLGAASQAALLIVLRDRGADGQKIILTALKCLQGAYYIDITERREANETFFAGWMLNRVEIAA